MRNCANHFEEKLGGHLELETRRNWCRMFRAGWTSTDDDDDDDMTLSKKIPCVEVCQDTPNDTFSTDHPSFPNFIHPGQRNRKSSTGWWASFAHAQTAPYHSGRSTNGSAAAAQQQRAIINTARNAKERARRRKEGGEG